MSQLTANPIRQPDSGSPAIMTRRAWWLVLLNVLIPGSAQVLAGSKRLGRFGLTATLTMWLLLIATAVLWFTARSWVMSVALNSWTLTAVQILCAGYALLWLVLTFDTLRLARLIKARPGARPAIAAVTVLLMVVTVGGASAGAYLTGVARGGVQSIFGGGASEPAADGRYNILVLGGDAGDGRDGLRPDSMSVVSIDASSGKAVMIGLPRDMLNVPFSEGSPMATRYPDGYRNCDVSACKLNSIYTEAEIRHPDWYPDAVAKESSPGIEATREAAEGITGLTIQYYALIDMQGFSDLIDALGGVEINVRERLPIGGDEQLNNVDEWIEPGLQRLDGFHAQWYARSRHSTSDFDRMLRQRELQEAVLKQFEPVNVLTKFRAITEAGAQVVKTDIPQDMLGYFVDLATKTRAQPIETVELTPDNGVNQDSPDFAAIRAMVDAALAGSSPSPSSGTP